MFLHFLCWKTTTSKCCKNTVNTDVFEGPCAENTVNTVVFGATCKKPRTYRVFCAFWLKSIGMYGVFWSPSAENCVNSMVFERFWTSGKQKLLVFTGFCDATLEKHWFLQGFHAFFSCDFINFLHRLTGLDVDKTLPLRALARATLDMRPFSSSFHLGGIAGVRSLSIYHTHNYSMHLWMVLHVPSSCSPHSPPGVPDASFGSPEMTCWWSFCTKRKGHKKIHQTYFVKI